MPHLESRHISFRPVTVTDINLLETWLHRPHFRKWWGDPDVELEAIEKMVRGDDTTKPFIILLNNEPFGYIQYWLAKDNQDPQSIGEYPWLAKLPPDAIGVDISIADSQHLSRGYGTEILSKFIEYLHSIGHRRFVIDPHASNKRAIRAYQKAGFSIMPELAGTTGETIIMKQELQREKH